MVNSGKSSLLSTITAVVCIILYAAALVYGAARIVSSSKDRSIAAESEFNDITDRASSAAVLGFMSTPYQNAILDSITESRTILGVIITGSNGEYGFERQPGTVIIWTGNSARFKTGFGISGTPFYKSVWIEGQRNATVQAVYSYLDYDLLIQVLKETLIFIFIVMALAIFVLLLDMNLKSLKGKAEISGPSSLDDEESADKESGDDEESADDEQSAQSDLPEDDFAEYESDSDNEPVAEEPDLPEPQTAKQQKVEPQTAEAQTAKPQTAAAKKEEYPKGLFSPRGIGWESYTKERLESELHRCASLEEDLVLMIMEPRKSKLSDESLNKLIAECTGFFTLRDMIFEKGEQGLSLIIPALNIDQGFVKAEEFRSRIAGHITDLVGNPPDLCAGLSSRSGRLVEAERLIMEAGQALAKASGDPQSSVVAFKSDPEKYRKFISRKNTSQAGV